MEQNHLPPSRAEIEVWAELIAERVAAKLRTGLIVPQTLSCDEFAEYVGRGAKWVRRQIRARRIKTVAGRRPYRIPASELQRVMKV